MSLFDSPSRRIVGINLFLMLALQATYFVGIIGCATYDLGAGALEVSALTFSLNTLLVVGNLVSGPIIDRVGPRKTLIAILAAIVAFGFFGWLCPVSYPSLFLAAVTNGFFFGAGTTAIDAYPRFFSQDAKDLVRTNSLSQVATGISVILGPALAGWITTWAPNQCVFSIMALAPFPALALAWATREEKPVGPRALAAEENSAAASGDPAAPADKPNFFREVWEGVKIVFSKDDLRILFIISFLGFFAYGAFDSLESLFYRDVLLVDSDWMGWLSSAAGIGGTLGSLLVLKIDHKKFSTWLLSMVLVLVGTGSMVYTGTPFVLVAAVGQIVTGVGFGMLAPIRTTLMQMRCDSSTIGRVASVMRVAMNSAGALPLLAAPALSALFGPQAVLFGASTFAALLGVVCAWLYRGTRVK